MELFDFLMNSFPLRNKEAWHLNIASYITQSRTWPTTRGEAMVQRGAGYMEIYLFFPGKLSWLHHYNHFLSLSSMDDTAI